MFAVLDAYASTLARKVWSQPYGIHDPNSPAYQVPWLSVHPGFGTVAMWESMLAWFAQWYKTRGMGIMTMETMIHMLSARTKTNQIRELSSMDRHSHPRG